MSIACRRNAAVLGSLLLLSSLGFGAWTQLTLGVPADLMAVHFPAGTQVGYAVGVGPDSVGGFGGIVVKTTDGGTTWTAKSTGTLGVLSSVYFTNDDNGYAVGEAGTALRTTDGGANWTAMTIPAGSGFLTKVQFPERTQVGYIGVHPSSLGKVLKTTDGGSNWSAIAVGGPMATSYSCGMATDNIGVVLGYGGMLYGTTDGFGGGATQGPLTIADLVAAAFSPTDPNTGYLIGNDTATGLGVIRYTDDGGANLWDTVRCWNVPAFYGVDVPATDRAYICGSGGNILRSVSPTDFFRTTVPDGFTTTINGLCFPAGVDTGYAVGAAGTILKTTDGGIPLLPGVAEGKAPAIGRTGIRVVSNPSRLGIALHSDANVNVVVYDAAGRTVLRQAATTGTNFLRLSAGAYFVKAGAQTARAVVTD
jgi:photosystem II stability/assembly factor-like uncharacterized protein